MIAERVQRVYCLWTVHRAIWEFHFLVVRGAVSNLFSWKRKWKRINGDVGWISFVVKEIKSEVMTKHRHQIFHTNWCRPFPGWSWLYMPTPFQNNASPMTSWQFKMNMWMKLISSCSVSGLMASWCALLPHHSVSSFSEPAFDYSLRLKLLRELLLDFTHSLQISHASGEREVVSSRDEEEVWGRGDRGAVEIERARETEEWKCHGLEVTICFLYPFNPL